MMMMIMMMMMMMLMMMWGFMSSEIYVRGQPWTSVDCASYHWDTSGAVWWHTLPPGLHCVRQGWMTAICHPFLLLQLYRVQELCESRGGRPGFSVLMSLMVSVDVKQYWIVLRHWSQFVPSMPADIRGHEALLHLLQLYPAHTRCL